jgi:hypothetical protein
MRSSRQHDSLSQERRLGDASGLQVSEKVFGGKSFNWPETLLWSVLTSTAVVVVYAVTARAHGSFFAAVCRWDCGWYSAIAQAGY